MEATQVEVGERYRGTWYIHLVRTWYLVANSSTSSALPKTQMCIQSGATPTTECIVSHAVILSRVKAEIIRQLQSSLYSQGFESDRFLILNPARIGFLHRDAFFSQVTRDPNIITGCMWQPCLSLGSALFLLFRPPTRDVAASPRLTRFPWHQR